MSKTHIYFIKPIGADGPIKIGCSIAPQARLECLYTWSPLPLEVVAFVPGTFPDECFLHQCFAADHSHREWFHFSPKLRDAIEAIRAAGTVDAVRGMLVPTGSIRHGKMKDRTHENWGRLSYVNRIGRAIKRLREADEASACGVPDDITAIMNRWRQKPRTGGYPTEAEFARLDEFLANPAAHAVLEFKRAAA